ncbi:lytic murein transglycosylase B [Aquabacterium sp. A7-Y]|uniref:lytic murein transglycosylase B n=1 Tax=Aquabacterium sp. A7-Y TaxID=1349605 RepID=UPI00223DBA24|nr:lytic murein transglycosylase B [Aquabacterium sp. A7-Y]MCW7538183.1 lytic murein transglycosylase B [Aquabacterium sp. A7-Y]
MPEPTLLPFLRRARPGLPAALLATALALAARPAPAQNTTPPPAPAAAEAPDVVTYGGRADVMTLADEMAQRRGLDAGWVRDTLSRSRYIPAVARFIMPSAAGSAKNWTAYRSRFVEPRRIRAGLAFWQANERWLRQAEEMYGVPADVVVGIVGVETIYGQHMGNFRVLDALATLSFDFPAGRRDRSAFFREELEQFLVLCRSEGLDPVAPRGSYAGAMGMPQFMPSSWNRYAVDFDGDGRIDLHASAPDVIGSVAHYLSEFGWQRGQPTHFEVAAPVDLRDRAVLLAPDILPSFTAEQFAAQGAGLSPEGRAYTGKLALVELQNGEAAPSFVAGTANFYAITRYNWSSYYAMAVIELGRSVAALQQARSLAPALP